MPKISKVWGREILDSRGNPTVEVEMTLSNGVQARAGVPSGASTGAHEAHELRDGDKKRYLGKGVRNAVASVNGPISSAIVGMDAKQQSRLDKALIDLDGTPTKSKLGANAILGVSLAAAKAAATSQGQALFGYIGGEQAFKLPVPLMNILNGGAHADNGLNVQEFMIVPVSGGKFSEALRAGSEIFHTLKGILKQKGLATGVGDEGGFAPVLKSNRQALELIAEAVQVSGYKLGQDIMLALDVAATELFSEGRYSWEGKSISNDELIDVYAQWSKDFPLVSIEDGLAEDDWNGWKKITERLGEKLQLVGDDLFVTNPERLRRGIAEKIGNALLVKVNQIGTLTETLEAVKIAQSANYKTVLSHRSGETEDSSIADIAVATSSQQIKTGSLCRGERIAKYNQLLRIEESLGSRAQFWGTRAFQ